MQCQQVTKTDELAKNPILGDRLILGGITTEIRFVRVVLVDMLRDGGGDRRGLGPKQA